MSVIPPQTPRFITASAVAQRDTSYPDIYANQLRMGITLSDFTIIFSTMNDRTNTLEDKATVRLAPLTAKILLQNLQMTLGVYEGEFGNLTLPPKAEAQLKMHRQRLIDHLNEQMAPMPAADQPDRR